MPCEASVASREAARRSASTPRWNHEKCDVFVTAFARIRESSDAPPPAGKDILEVGAGRAGDEHEEAVARLDLRAAARRQRAAPAGDHGDERIAGKAELSAPRARHRVICRDRELDEV